MTTSRSVGDIFEVLKLQLHDAIYLLRFYSNLLIHILSLSNLHNNEAPIQKNRGDVMTPYFVWLRLGIQRGKKSFGISFITANVDKIVTFLRLHQSFSPGHLALLDDKVKQTKLATLLLNIYHSLI